MIGDGSKVAKQLILMWGDYFGLIRHPSMITSVPFVFFNNIETETFRAG